MTSFENIRSTIDSLVRDDITLSDLRAAQWEEVASMLGGAMARARSGRLTAEERAYLQSLPARINAMDPVLEDPASDGGFDKVVDARLTNVLDTVTDILNADQHSA